jgi:hypothetical protein
VFSPAGAQILSDDYLHLDWLVLMEWSAVQSA